MSDTPVKPTLRRSVHFNVQDSDHGPKDTDLNSMDMMEDFDSPQDSFQPYNRQERRLGAPSSTLYRYSETPPQQSTPSALRSNPFLTAPEELDATSYMNILEYGGAQSLRSHHILGPESRGVAPNLDNRALSAITYSTGEAAPSSPRVDSGTGAGMTEVEDEVRGDNSSKSKLNLDRTAGDGGWQQVQHNSIAYPARSRGALVRSPESNIPASDHSWAESPYDTTSYHPHGHVKPLSIYRHTKTGPSNPMSRIRSALHHPPASTVGLSAHLIRAGGSSRLEEGGGPRPSQGVFTNLLKLYGLKNRQLRSHSQMSDASHGDGSRSRCDSLDSSFFPTARGEENRSRCSSMMSEGGMDMYDEDDPRITGVKVNTIDQERHAKATVEAHSALDKKKKKSASIRYHISSVLARQTFVLRLAKALMLFGSPSHRLEGQLKATAIVLDVEAEFVHMPNIVIASFGDIDTKTSRTHFIKVNGVLQLGRLHAVHKLYRQVVHDEMGVEEATMELNKLMRSRPIYGVIGKTVLASLCTALICPLAFGGSFLDMLIAGGEGALLSWLQFGVASKNAMYSNVFEISVAIIMSFIARGLSSIQSNLFCYSAISSAGVVLVLPGYMILCSALELASKNIVGGSVKLVFAIVYSLFLGFGLTIGSDLYLLIDPHARNAQIAATEGLDNVIINGIFTSRNATNIQNFAGTFTFSNATASTPLPSLEVAGCYRDPSWPWYLQPFPIWSLFILVPAFSVFSSVSNGQPFKSKQLPIMVLISCLSFAANDAASHYIFNRSDVVSAIGAFVAGVLGNLYSRVTKTGTSFTSMVTGVLFLVPAGIAATGGLSQNYRGQDGDEYSNGLIIGLRTVQVAIGITVGLFASSLLIYSFGRSKRGAIFAF